jgi:type IX secretion system PorP/SprF family membrane protein
MIKLIMKYPFYKAMTKKIIMLCMLLYAVQSASGQDAVVYNEYINNPFLYNPAWAGSTVHDELRCSVREQWVGIADAPSTQTLSFQKKFNKVGLGGFLYNDKNGRTGYQGFEFAYSYRVQLSSYMSVKKQNMLVFGISLGMHHYKVDLASLLAEGTDPALISGNSSASVPSLNFGLLYRNGNYNLGFSASQLLSKTVRFGDIDAQSLKPGTFYLYNSFNFKISPFYELAPSLLLKYNQNNEKQFDLSLKGTYNGPFNIDLWMGATYRRVMDASSGTGNALVPSLGIIYNQYYFGYIYELGLSELANYNKGTHEITFGYNFNGARGRKLKSPSYRPDIDN